MLDNVIIVTHDLTMIALFYSIQYYFNYYLLGTFNLYSIFQYIYVMHICIIYRHPRLPIFVNFYVYSFCID